MFVIFEKFFSNKIHFVRNLIRMQTYVFNARVEIISQMKLTDVFQIHLQQKVVLNLFPNQSVKNVIKNYILKIINVIMWM